MKQTKPVVYSGKVGAKMRAKRISTSRRVTKWAFHCRGGPMNGRTLYLSSPETVEFTMSGATGRYASGNNPGAFLQWEPKNA